MNGRGAQLSERLLDFVVSINKIVDALPNTIAGKHIGGQLISAGTSCGANYEEGCGAESRSDFVHKMSIGLKELKETRYWLQVIRRTEIVVPKDTNPVMDECEQLCAIIGKSASTAKKKKNE